MKTTTKKKKERPADKAFEESVNHVLGDLKLQPYSPSRLVAAQAMGLKYPNVPKGFEQYSQTGSYPGLLRDVIVVLGVCTMDDDAVDKAQLDPDEAYQKAQKWADGKGILKAGSKEFLAAKSMFEKVMIEIYNSQSEPENNGKHSIDDEDELGNE